MSPRIISSREYEEIEKGIIDRLNKKKLNKLRNKSNPKENEIDNININNRQENDQIKSKIKISSNKNKNNFTDLKMKLKENTFNTIS